MGLFSSIMALLKAGKGFAHHHRNKHYLCGACLPEDLFDLMHRGYTLYLLSAGWTPPQPNCSDCGSLIPVELEGTEGNKN